MDTSLLFSWDCARHFPRFMFFDVRGYEGGGGSYVFLVKDTGAQGNSAPSPQSFQSPTPAVSFSLS